MRIDKGKMLWHRLSFASNLISFLNTRRENEIDATRAPQDFISPNMAFKTIDAQAIWILASEYTAILPVVERALHDAELLNFEQVSSVNIDYDGDRLGGSSSYLAKLCQVNLMRHTLHVVCCAARMSERSGNNAQTLFLLALLHDFGKHKAIRDLHSSMQWKKHEQISANYTRFIMNNCNMYEDDYIETIVSIISTHHSMATTRPPLLIKLLNDADREARAIEGHK